MSVCYCSQTDPSKMIDVNYSGVDLISYTMAALHLPIYQNTICPGAAPRIPYAALKADVEAWAAVIRKAVVVSDVALRECFAEYGFLIDGGWENYLAWLGEWVEFFETCGGYKA